jgi:protein-disulfide isomerase
VQSSTWSLWLGLPVAVAGLACYASLAGLSVLTGLRGDRAARWVGTLLVMLSCIVALSGLWFTAIQLFVLKSYCMECIGLHVCGWAVAGLVLWTTLRRRNAAPTGVMSARAAGPAPGAAALSRGVLGVPSRPAQARVTGAPSLALAAGGAASIVALLIIGQLVFPADSSVRVKNPLTETIQLDGSDGAASGSLPAAGSKDSQLYTANRVPTDADAGQVVTAAHVVSDAGSGTSNVEVPETRIVRSETPDQQPAAAVQNDVPKPSVESPPRERLVSFLEGKLTLDVYKHPILGSPEAPHFVVEFVSYDCPHCHKMHRVVKRALERYGNQVAVIVLLIPFEMECNKDIKDPKNSHPGSCATARLALSVAQIDPAQFPKLHDWLMADKEKAPPLSQVVQRSQSLVERDRLREMPNDRLNKQIGQYVDLFTRIQSQARSDGKQLGLPLTILGDELISGAIEGDEKVFEAWETNLGIKPVQATGGTGL